MIYFSNATLDEINLVRNKLKNKGISSSALYSSANLCLPIDKFYGDLLTESLSMWIEKVKEDENEIVSDHSDHSIKVAEFVLCDLIDDIATLQSKPIDSTTYKNLFYNNVWQMEIWSNHPTEIDDDTYDLISSVCNENNIEHQEVNAIQYYLDECTFDEIKNSLLEYSLSPLESNKVIDAIELLTLLCKSSSMYQSDYQYEALLVVMLQLRNENIGTSQFAKIATDFIEQLDETKWGEKSIKNIYNIVSVINERNKFSSLKKIESIVY